VQASARTPSGFRGWHITLIISCQSSNKASN
jgi:hypothetical protein